MQQQLYRWIALRIQSEIWGHNPKNIPIWGGQLKVSLAPAFPKLHHWSKIYPLYSYWLVLPFYLNFRDVTIMLVNFNREFLELRGNWLTPQ